MKNENYLDSKIKQVQSAKDFMYERFRELEINFYVSHGNFVLFEPKLPEVIVTELKSRKIYIRDKSKSTGGGVRVTVTDMSDMKKFMSALSDIVNNQKKAKF